MMIISGEKRTTKWTFKWDLYKCGIELSIEEDYKNIMLNYNFTVSLLSVSVGNYYVDIAGQKLILAKNVVALFKKEKYIKGLQNLCAENLMEFLGQEVDPQHCSKSTVT
ncbi:uncharacterized protein LOC113309217 isoform X1 [Papaver somniferum]|uniref:uncharacterized protein LOC113309217 isoform X1 n=1 Tax=Papaver somniferum TaxID=3469 RepID=UPI000E6FB067|nr:uncharacterized protein LOC113309217 isoform X1 [Papaver somniferum]